MQRRPLHYHSMHGKQIADLEKISSESGWEEGSNPVGHLIHFLLLARTPSHSQKGTKIYGPNSKKFPMEGYQPPYGLQCCGLVSGV